VFQVPTETILACFDDCAKDTLITNGTAQVLASLAETSTNFREHVQFSRQIIKSLIVDQLGGQQTPSSSPEAALFVFGVAAEASAAQSNYVLTEIATTLDVTSATLVSILRSGDTSTIVSCWPHLIQLFVNLATIDAARGTELMSGHFATDDFVSALTQCLTASSTECTKLKTISLLGELLSMLPSVWTPLIARHGCLDFIFDSLLRKREVNYDSLDEGAQDTYSHNVHTIMCTLNVFAAISAFRNVFSFAFTKLFNAITKHISDADTAVVTDEGLQLLHNMLMVPNICTSASLIDAVLPFYHDLASSEIVRAVLPGETLAAIFRWFKFDIPDEAVGKIATCVNTVMVSTVASEGCRELQLRTSCMLLDSLMCGLQQQTTPRPATQEFAQDLLVCFDTLVLEQFFGDAMVSDSFVSETYAKLLSLIRTIICPDSWVVSGELQQKMAVKLAKCCFLRRLLELKSIYNDDNLIKHVHSLLLRILCLAGVCGQEDAAVFEQVVRSLPVAPHEIVECLAHPRPFPTDEQHHKELLCFTLVFAVVKEQDKLTDDTSTYNAVCSFLLARAGGEQEPLSPQTLKQAAFLMSKLCHSCCPNLHAQDKLLSQIRDDVCHGRCAVYCEDASVLRWLWEKFDHSISSELITGALTPAVAEECDETDEIFTSSRGIRVLGNILSGEHSEDLRQCAIRVLFSVVERGLVSDVHANVLAGELHRLFSLKGICCPSDSLIAALELAMAIVSMPGGGDREPRRRMFSAVVQYIQRDPRCCQTTSMVPQLVLTSLNLLSFYVFENLRTREGGLSEVQGLGGMAKGWSQLRDNQVADNLPAINVASQQFMLLMSICRGQTSSACPDSEASNPSESSLESPWTCASTELIEILRTALSETHRILATRHYAMAKGRTAHPGGAVRGVSELQMLLIDQIAAPDTSARMKNAALGALTTSITEMGSVPVAWHRFILGLLTTAAPRDQNEPGPTIAFYLQALRGRGFGLSQLIEGCSSSVCSHLLMEASAASPDFPASLLATRPVEEQSKSPALWLLEGMQAEKLLTHVESEAVSRALRLGSERRASRQKVAPPSSQAGEQDRGDASAFDSFDGAALIITALLE